MDYWDKGGLLCAHFLFIVCVHTVSIKEIESLSVKNIAEITRLGINKAGI